MPSNDWVAAHGTTFIPCFIAFGHLVRNCRWTYTYIHRQHGDLIPLFSDAAILHGFWSPPWFFSIFVEKGLSEILVSGRLATVDVFLLGSLAPFPNSNLENLGLHLVWPLPFDMSHIGGSTRSLCSRQHSFPGHLFNWLCFFLWEIKIDS
jgi:hypothetical protein